jgi:hypothetical protein
VAYDAGIQSRVAASGAAAGATVPAGIQAAAGFVRLGKVAALPTILRVIFIVLLVTRKNKQPAPAAA